VTTYAEVTPDPTVLAVEPDPPVGLQRRTEPAPRWRGATRVAFRFTFSYFTLYIVFTQMIAGLLYLPVGRLPQFGEIPPMPMLIEWTAKHLFGVTRPLVILGSGSGDKTYDWVQAFCLLVIALVATAIWSALDRRRPNYATMHKWFRLFVRFALGSTMISYGIAKAIPLQMPTLFLSRLIEPYGNFSPMGVLWYSIGAAPYYERFVGCAELLGGLLVFLPRTSLLGALICLADATEIFALNMTYDVPVKLFAFHLILLSLVLIAPDAIRLANLFLLNRNPGASTQQALAKSVRGNRMAVAAQVVFGAYLLGMNVRASVQSRRAFGEAAPRSALFGIWNVDEMSIDGQTRAPLLTDHERWRRVVFQRTTGMTLQQMDETLVPYGAVIDTITRSIAVTKGGDKAWKAAFSFQRPSKEQLLLDGDMDGHKIHMRLQLFDYTRYLVVNRGFNWIQEYPFNR
jgi:hypothetical protein